LLYSIKFHKLLFLDLKVFALGYTDMKGLDWFFYFQITKCVWAKLHSSKNLCASFAESQLVSWATPTLMCVLLYAYAYLLMTSHNRVMLKYQQGELKINFLMYHYKVWTWCCKNFQVYGMNTNSTCRPKCTYMLINSQQL